MKFKARYKFGEITKRWGDANFKKEFDDVLGNWLEQFQPEERPVLLELLRNFYYYTETSVDKKVVELHKQFLEKNGEDISDVIFAKVPKEYSVAKSDIIFLSYWKNNAIGEYCSNDIVRDFLEYDAIPSTLVIVDDYMGTGNTIIKALTRMLDTAPELQNSKIYVLLLHVSNVGIENLNKYAESCNLDLEIIYLDYTEKAFQEDYIFTKIDVKLKEDEYRSICKNKGIREKYVMGYEDVQSLVAFQTTTPNDTLGLFWHSAENFVSLFHRDKKTGGTSINELKKIAKRNAHREGALFNIEDNQYNKFIVYCVVYGENFSFGRACDDFGITPDILGKRLQYIHQHGYIKFEGGRILPTVETEMKMIKKKLKGWKAAEEELQREGKIPLVETTYIPRNFSQSFSGYNK